MVQKDQGLSQPSKAKIQTETIVFEILEVARDHSHNKKFVSEKKTNYFFSDDKQIAHH